MTLLSQVHIRHTCLPQLDVSSGILVPLLDPDTGMVFLAGKGDRYIQAVELTDREPWVVEGLRYTGEQTKGACLVPKRAGWFDKIQFLCKFYNGL